MKGTDAAFARPSYGPQQGVNHEGCEITSLQDGMDLRTYIAAKALQGLLACEFHPPIEPPFTLGQLCARYAVQYADALVAELNKPQRSE